MGEGRGEEERVGKMGEGRGEEGRVGKMGEGRVGKMGGKGEWERRESEKGGESMKAK